MVERNILQLQPTDQTVPMTDWLTGCQTEYLTGWIANDFQLFYVPQGLITRLAIYRIVNTCPKLGQAKKIEMKEPNRKNYGMRPHETCNYEINVSTSGSNVRCSTRTLEKNSTWEVFNWGKTRLEPVIKASQESRIVCRHFWTLCLKNGMRQFLHQG